MAPTATEQNYSYALLARIDKHAEALTPTERQVFLRAQLIKWTENFERWMAAVEQGENLQRFGKAIALDFHLTIAGISQRIARETDQAA